VRVSCHHHSGDPRLAPGLRVTARGGRDGRAVEVLGQAFAVGVQWPPEEDSEDTRLSPRLVAAARQHRYGDTGPGRGRRG